MPDNTPPDPNTDPFRPPEIPTEVFCLHCGREYESYLIEWVEEDNDGRREGFWCCPTAGCSGKGFGFDILPTDPEWRDDRGQKVWSDDDEEEDDDDAPVDFGRLDDGDREADSDDNDADDEEPPW